MNKDTLENSKFYWYVMVVNYRNSQICENLTLNMPFNILSISLCCSSSCKIKPTKYEFRYKKSEYLHYKKRELQDFAVLLWNHTKISADKLRISCTNARDVADSKFAGYRISGSSLSGRISGRIPDSSTKPKSIFGCFLSTAPRYRFARLASHETIA